MPKRALDVFREHIDACGYSLTDDAWRSISRQCSEIEAPRGSVLLSSASVAEHLFFICDGIAASFQVDADGDTQIARFFEHGQLASNITSAWHQSVSNDELIAMSDFSGIRVPFAMFRDEFMHGGPLGEYWREMTLNTLLFDKDLMCAKTVRNLGRRYRFLVERYRNVVDDVPAKHLALFLGVTPQGLSRFLNNQRHELT